MALQFTYGPSYTDSLLSTTASWWMQNKLEDQIFNQTPFVAELYKKAIKADGGASILVPLMYEANSTATWYSGYDNLNTLPQDGMTTAQAKWKNLATSISISGEEERMNSGKAKLINLLEGKTTQAELSLQSELTSALFATSAATKKIKPLPVMMDATSTVQDINSTSSSFWQAQVNASSTSFATGGLAAMRTMWTAIAKVAPNTVPDIIVTTDTVYNYYEGSLTPMTRYTSSDKTGNGSFENLMFKTAKVFYDAGCNSGYMYMFPSDNLKLVINSNADYKKTEFVKPSNQDAKVAQIIIMLELVTNARRKLGKFTAFTA
jgi:hypothetical protein